VFLPSFLQLRVAVLIIRLLRFWIRHHCPFAMTTLGYRMDLIGGFRPRQVPKSPATICRIEANLVHFNGLGFDGFLESPGGSAGIKWG
jgi:hypothetical protein